MADGDPKELEREGAGVIGMGEGGGQCVLFGFHLIVVCHDVLVFVDAHKDLDLPLEGSLIATEL